MALHIALIPAILNRAAGRSRAAEEALESSGLYATRLVEPAEVSDAVTEALAEGADRILVGGGDGSLSAAAAVLAGTDTALIAFPAGTLNHFARDHGIPTDLARAAQLGLSSRVRTVDVGFVNDRIFLNTSSVGGYVLFVRAREQLERHLGYRLASLLAPFRLLGRVHTFRVEIDVRGTSHRSRASLLFVGIGERELRVPILGGRVADGRRALHLMIVHGGTVSRLLTLGLRAVARGVRAVRGGELLGSFLVDSARIDLPRPWGTVAMDGELVPMQAPLNYRIARDALRLVVPEE